MSDEHREAAVNVCMANTPHTDCYVPDGWLTDHISTVTSGGGAMSDEYLEAAAKRAIELGWTCDGHEPRDDCDICMGLWILHLPELFEAWVGDRELLERCPHMAHDQHTNCQSFPIVRVSVNEGEPQ